MGYKSYKNTISQNKSPKDVIRAYEWNNLFKILGEQANHLNAGLIELDELFQSQEDRVGLRDHQIEELQERATLLELNPVIHIQEEEPENAKDGDLWYKIID